MNRRDFCSIVFLWVSNLMAETQFPSADSGITKGTEPEVRYGPGGLPEPSDNNDETDLITYFRMRNRYILPQGNVGAPVCRAPSEGGDDTAFAIVHLPVAALSVDWQCWRKGARAELPRPYLQDGNTILLKNEIDLDNVEIEGDDNSYFISAGTILYSFKNRKAITLAYPVPTYLELPKGANIVNDSDFVPAILNFGWPDNKQSAAVTKVSQ